jgi:carbonic anhydrase
MTKNKSLGFLLALLLIASLMLISGCTSQGKTAGTTAPGKTTSAAPDSVYKRPADVATAADARKLLIEGNERFVSGKLANKDLGQAKRDELLKGQHPFAAVVSCSDSRVPPELLFDQGLGDIFIIRDAGNIVDPVSMGSVEYAVEHVKVPLVVVLGHEKCGAVTATVQGGEAPGSIGSIVQTIKPSVDKAKASGSNSQEELIEKSADENIKAVVAEIKKSPVVKEAIEHGHVKVMGAKYHLATGQVEWLDAGK